MYHPPSMNCPGCRAPMKTMTFTTSLGGAVEIDACVACRAFWFDAFETLHLAPRSTLELIAFIGEQAGAPAQAWPRTSRCPRCGAQLLLTHDRQRATAFQYWRCDAGHGRFTSFIDFMREKEYIRTLTLQQINEIRDKIQFVHCSNCGGAVDLSKDSVCPHCHAPLSIVDTKKMGEIAQQLRQPQAAIVLPPLRPEKPVNLVDAGLEVVSAWLRTWLE